MVFVLDLLIVVVLSLIGFLYFCSCHSMKEKQLFESHPIGVWIGLFFSCHVHSSASSRYGQSNRNLFLLISIFSSRYCSLLFYVVIESSLFSFNTPSIIFSQIFQIVKHECHQCRSIFVHYITINLSSEQIVSLRRSKPLYVRRQTEQREYN